MSTPTSSDVEKRPFQKAWDADKMADEVADFIGLTEDLVGEEVRTAESRGEAVKRLEKIIDDVQEALDIVSA